MAKQKPKRIRKNKKDFFRGTIDQQEFKPQYTDTVFPFRYVLLFSLLAATIFLYTPLTFLLEKLSTINLGVNLSFLTSLVKSTHIRLPDVNLPQPRMNLPVFSIETDKMLLQIIHSTTIPTKRLGILSFQILRLSNPLPLLTATTNSINKISSIVFIQIIQFAISMYKTMLFLIAEIQKICINIVLWIFSLIQNTFIFIVKNLNPLPLLPEVELIFIRAFSGIGNTLVQGFFWFLSTLQEYFALLGTIIATTTLFVFHGLITISSFLVQGIVFIITTLTSAIITLFVFIEKLLVMTVYETRTIVTTIFLGIFHFFINVVQLLGALYKYLANSIIGMLLIVWGWLMEGIVAFKRSIDNFLNTISQFFHQFDPEANFLGNSISESVRGLFSNMGQIFSTAPGFLTGKSNLH